MHKNLSEVRVSKNASLKEVISVMNQNSRQFVLVLDKEDSLLGLITDGDIRRALLAGVNLDSSAEEVMNNSPFTLSEGFLPHKAFEIMASKGLHQIPVINSLLKVTGYVSIDDLNRVHELSTPVILMAGGKGQRLYPLTKDVPKPMLEIGGTPIIGLILEKLKLQGFKEVHISVNYLSEQIINYVSDGTKFGLEVQYIHEDTPLGTAGALAVKKGKFAEPFIVMNSDLITEVNLRGLVDFHNDFGAKATLGVREHVLQVPFGVVEVTNNQVRSLAEKPVHRSLVSAGIYVLSPEVLELLSEGEYCDMPTLLSNVMSNDGIVGAFPIHESWLDVGRPEDLYSAQNSTN